MAKCVHHKEARITWINIFHYKEQRLKINIQSLPPCPLQSLPWHPFTVEKRRDENNLISRICKSLNSHLKLVDLPLRNHWIWIFFIASGERWLKGPLFPLNVRCPQQSKNPNSTRSGSGWCARESEKPLPKRQRLPWWSWGPLSNPVPCSGEARK